MKCVICNKEIEKSSYYDKIICSSECFMIDFWNEKVNDKNNINVVRAEGEQYYIGNENNNNSFRGFGGRKFVVKFFDGREVVSTNLWYNGAIPEDFKERLLDNAEFVR